MVDLLSIKGQRAVLNNQKYVSATDDDSGRDITDSVDEISQWVRRVGCPYSVRVKELPPGKCGYSQKDIRLKK